MSHYPPTLVKLIREFSRLPGIGEKTAERLAMHILKAPQKQALALSDAIRDAREKMSLCQTCFGLADGQSCHICGNSARDSSLVCVVEQPADMVALEKSGAFSGSYHVLQGVLAPMDGVGPENLRIAELLNRIAAGGITEVVIATGTSVEGEATASYLSRVLAEKGVSVTRIASGVPIGGELQYLDGLTLKRALDYRRKV
ncbi:MAG: recombination mediator RecR [Desulfatibacillaceae bacterium]|nr:recombination mediator RecR [Desulfatibacillaceae bacterium]